MKKTIDLENIAKSDVSYAGGKGASLGELMQAGFPVPPGFVVTTSVFNDFIRDNDLHLKISEALNDVALDRPSTINSSSRAIQSLLSQLKISDGLVKEIVNSYKDLEEEFVAVRSSANVEDSEGAAWAGQLESYLNTTEKQLLSSIKQCWASLFTPRAIFYGLEKKVLDANSLVAVIVQKMVNSDSSGVAFTAHPVTQNENQVVIEACLGLGEAVVSGQITPDNYVVEKNFDYLNIFEGNQTRGLFKNDVGGNEWRKVPELQTLSENKIVRLAKLAISIEKHYGHPCDIEWAFESDDLYILQSRPITTFNS